MVLQNVYYYTALVVNSRVLIMYTDMVKELPGCPYKTVHLGVSFFEGGRVWYWYCVNGMPQKDTLENVRTPVCFRILSPSLTSVSIFSVWCYSSVSISVDYPTRRHSTSRLWCTQSKLNLHSHISTDAHSLQHPPPHFSSCRWHTHNTHMAKKW